MIYQLKGGKKHHTCFLSLVLCSQANVQLRFPGFHSPIDGSSLFSHLGDLFSTSRQLVVKHSLKAEHGKVAFGANSSQGTDCVTAL